MKNFGVEYPGLKPLPPAVPVPVRLDRGAEKNPKILSELVRDPVENGNPIGGRDVGEQQGSQWASLPASK